MLRKNWREFCLGKEDLSEGKRPHSTRWLPNLLVKNWREFRLGKEGPPEGKWPHSTKWVKKLLQKINESPVHVSIGFVSCNGGTVLKNQKKCEKNETYPPAGKKWRQVEEDECKTCLAKMGDSSGAYHSPREHPCQFPDIGKYQASKGKGSAAWRSH